MTVSSFNEINKVAQLQNYLYKILNWLVSCQNCTNKILLIMNIFLENENILTIALDILCIEMQTA